MDKKTAALTLLLRLYNLLKSCTINGARKTVIRPAVPIAKLLIAPSVSPSSIALEVPTA
jgi:hypothetical protein